MSEVPVDVRRPATGATDQNIIGYRYWASPRPLASIASVRYLGKGAFPPQMSTFEINVQVNVGTTLRHSPKTHLPAVHSRAPTHHTLCCRLAGCKYRETVPMLGIAVLLLSAGLQPARPHEPFRRDPPRSIKPSLKGH